MIPGLLVIGVATVSWLGAFAINRWFPNRVLDHPNERSSHIVAVPRSGGIAFGAAFFLGVLLAQVSGIADYRPRTTDILAIVAILGLIWVVGLVDDVLDASILTRYTVQLVAAGVAVSHFGSYAWAQAVPGAATAEWVAVGISVIAFTAIINLLNFMDGLDGFLGASSLVILSFLAIFLDQPIWMLLASAILGFLFWNWAPARLFMGDSGSTLIGASIAIALLMETDSSRSLQAAAVALPLLGDATYTLIRRLLSGEDVFAAHRTHIYQRLNQSGWSHRKVSILYTCCTALIAGAVLVLT